MIMAGWESLQGRPPGEAPHAAEPFKGGSRPTSQPNQGNIFTHVLALPIVSAAACLHAWAVGQRTPAATFGLLPSARAAPLARHRPLAPVGASAVLLLLLVLLQQPCGCCSAVLLLLCPSHADDPSLRSFPPSDALASLPPPFPAVSDCRDTLAHGSAPSQRLACCALGRCPGRWSGRYLGCALGRHRGRHPGCRRGLCPGHYPGRQFQRCVAHNSSCTAVHSIFIVRRTPCPALMQQLHTLASVLNGFMIAAAPAPPALAAMSSGKYDQVAQLSELLHKLNLAQMSIGAAESDPTVELPVYDDPSTPNREPDGHICSTSLTASGEDAGLSTPDCPVVLSPRIGWAPVPPTVPGMMSRRSALPQLLRRRQSEAGVG